MTPRNPRHLPFFVYGTLRPGQLNHDAFLRGRTETEEPGRLDGTVLYDGPGYPYAVEEPGAPHSVSGELATARPEAYDRLLLELDELEECVPGDPASLYVRVERDVVRLRDGAAVRAWVYLAGPAVTERLRADGRRIGGDWLTHRTPDGRRRTRPGPDVR
ncbi:gamma-glutamylcyclotransferase family protein [Streptomyces sp. NPDC007851]|uniref:gamma-glutamylcyclotransferase family protein n=1 Tax=Streptomyces sp. NPDC007851 TaxID=3155008 RepID=UPI0033DCA923